MMKDTPVTFVNVIEVDPARQRELAAILSEGYERVIRHRPGFLLGTVLASADGKHVVNVATWRAADDIQATRRDPEAAAYATRTAEIADARPMICHVIAEYRP